MPRARRSRFAAVVYNPAKAPRTKLAPLVDRTATDSGWGSTQWFPTDPDDAGVKATRRALESGCALVMVSGGDGTVRTAAEVLADTDIPMAILPQGTANVFARNLGMRVPALGRAVESAFRGEDRRVDLGEAVITAPDGTTSTGPFLVVAGIGLDGEIMARTTPVEKRLLGWLGYISAAVRVFNGDTKVRTRIEVPGREASTTRASMTLVCNCGFQPGNVLLVPGAEIDDGRLDILSVSPRRFRDWVGIVWRVLVDHRLSQTAAGSVFVQLAGTRKLRALAYAQGEEVVLTTASPREVELDGDPVGQARRLECRVRQGALLVRVPRSGRMRTTGESPA